ncbi:MAG: SUMF1/EgtB/PvdO family nonheme iron enzyme [Phycisphaerae bacterium]
MNNIRGACRRAWTLAAIAAAIASGAVTVGEPPALDLAFIPAEDAQPGGPDYDFRISRFEVRNDQYVAFLNDAMANLDNERGQFMYFDIDSGEVYIHAAAQGAIGTNGSGTFLFSAAANPYVSYNQDNAEYEVSLEGEDHPVTGMTWYGAVKFCNWLTIDTGLGLDERAYTEAPANDLDGWHPVTITTQNWAARDLNDEERDELLTRWGYRLPMDGGDGGGDPGPYNEWYKAAAWDGAMSVNHDYGFGRDNIDDPDANFRCSHDPFEDPLECIEGGTTPVGFYDGINLLGDDVTPTADTDNAYGLYDMSGNVWEWMQDQSFDQADRRNRGGSFRSSSSSLQVAIGAERTADSANDSTGFRVVQSVVSDLLVTPDTELINTGPWGGPYDGELPTAITYRVANVTEHDVQFTVLKDADWVAVDYDAPPGDLLAANGFVDVTVSLAPQCAHGLHAGLNAAAVTFLNLDDGTRIERGVRLTVIEPLALTPAEPFEASVLFGESPPTRTYTLTSESESSVNWSSSWVDTTDPPASADWVTLNGDPSGAAGTVEPEGTAEIDVGLDTAGLPVGTYTALVTFIDECTGTEFERSVALGIEAPFAVTPVDGVVSTGVKGGPFDPPSHVFTVENLTDDPVDWRVTLEPVAPETDVEWLEVDLPDGTLSTLGEEAEVTATLTPAANAKDVGQYSIKLRFEQVVEQEPTGFNIERVVTLDVTELAVEPEGDIAFRGLLGGPFEPLSHVYTLHNPGVTEMEWTAMFTEDSPSGRDWLELSETQGVILNPDGAADIVVTLSPEAALLDSGDYTGEITFTSVVTGATTTRHVTLIVGTEGFALTMVDVPPEHVQPGGPDYLYRIGKFEVTNAEFVRFLNDARDNPDNGRGEFMVHDTEAGIVRLTGDATVLFDATAGGAITFIDDRYVVLDGEDNQLPVVGVSWYGALKFCNWMTLIQGMDSPDQRAYHEGPSADDWYPIAQPPALLALRGFRLPMDDQAATASSHNEWYKAAAWINDPGINALYGFGRDTLTDADANFRESGDPFEPGPSPVGFFDGVNELADGGDRTNDTANAYSLYDITGNVAEWVQDTGDTSIERGLRGGHFDKPAGSPFLRNDARGSVPADSTFAFVGFRVVQVIEPAELDVTRDATRADGLVGGPYSRDTFTLEITNPGEQTVDDITISVNVDWLEVEAPKQVPPESTVAVPLHITDGTITAGISPAPPGDFVLVPGSESQPGGPDYDYWISRTEVTNAQFATFLNNALEDVRSQSPDMRSHHMFFDLDSGSVYINDVEAGEEGFDAPSDTLTTLLYDASVGRTHLIDDEFAVEQGFDNHPVVGVTWFGAIKYCNWLTVKEGIPAALRAYNEAPSPNLNGWHPVVVEDENWASGPMNDDARRFLIEDTLGYRLPMDDGATGASLYNEGYKAASRKGTDESGNPVFGALYGFGRDELLTGDDPLAGTDANYLESGDTEQDGTTPVRFFNGSHTLFQAPSDCFPPLPGPTVTQDTDNGYGLYDACGNVTEWTQDFFAGDSSRRATRVGSWRDAFDSDLLTTLGRRSLPPEVADDHTGFRVVRGTGHTATVTITDHLAGVSCQQHLILDLREPLTVDPLTGLAQQGRYGDLFAELAGPYILTNHSDAEMEWEVGVDQDWVDVTEPVEGELTGTIRSDEPLTIDVATNGLADALGPGTHTAVVTFRNLTTGQSQTREVELTIDQPINVTPDHDDPQEFSGMWGGPFGTPPDVRSYDLISDVDFDLEYGVSVDQPWLSVEPEDPVDQLSGTLPAADLITFAVSVNSAADALPVGEHDGAVRFAFIDPANDNLSDTVERAVKLIVQEPIVIAQDADPWVVGPNPDPDALPPEVYTLSNDINLPIEVLVGVDVDWVDLDDTVVEVLPGPGQEREVAASLNDRVLTLFDGQYVATLTFEDTVTGILQCRTIELTIVEDLSVAPFDDFVTAGIAGGPIAPPFKLYRLTNVARDGAGPVDWEAFVQEQDPVVDWILINGGPTAGGTLADGESTHVVISIDTDQTTNLDEGTHEAAVTFRVLPDGEPATRTVSLALVVPQFTVAESLVAATIEQPGGPTYSYNLAAYHTTNAEFVAFLNDTRENLNNERGQYMFFDTITGDVYVNPSMVGESGVDPGSRTIKMFSPVASGQIEFTGGAYQVLTAPIDYSQHPVTGVSWYGALKYSNWLTIDQGMLPGERCYSEDTDANLAGWHPVTISTSDWLTRDLTDDERLSLVTNYRGFRLPMDQGYDNTDVTTDRADEYNEWYKAAAWNETLRRNMTFGFGRQTLTGADANFVDSGDPLDNGTTPVGYFDGSVRGGSFSTNPNDNGFGLFDMTGNAYQWMQGRFNTHSESISFRTLRGGSWNEPVGSLNLRTDARTYTLPSLTDAQIGFRVVRTVAPPTGDFDFDGDVDGDDYAAATVCLVGPDAGSIPGCGVLDLDMDGDIDLRDFATFQILFTGSP